MMEETNYYFKALKCRNFIFLLCVLVVFFVVNTFAQSGCPTLDSPNRGWKKNINTSLPTTVSYYIDPNFDNTINGQTVAVDMKKQIRDAFAEWTTKSLTSTCLKVSFVEPMILILPY